MSRLSTDTWPIFLWLFWETVPFQSPFTLCMGIRRTYSRHTSPGSPRSDPHVVLCFAGATKMDRQTDKQWSAYPASHNPLVVVMAVWSQYWTDRWTDGQTDGQRVKCLPGLTQPTGAGHGCLVAVFACGAQHTVHLSLQPSGVAVRALGAGHRVRGAHGAVEALWADISISSCNTGTFH